MDPQSHPPHPALPCPALHSIAGCWPGCSVPTVFKAAGRRMSPEGEAEDLDRQGGTSYGRDFYEDRPPL